MEVGASDDGGVKVWLRGDRCLALAHAHNAHVRKTRRVFSADHNREVSGILLTKQCGAVMLETLRVWSAVK